MGRNTQVATVKYAARLGYVAEGIMADLYRLVEEDKRLKNEDELTIRGYAVSEAPTCSQPLIYPAFGMAKGDKEVFILDECQYNSGDYTIFSDNYFSVMSFLKDFNLLDEANIEENVAIQQTL